jgi:hypothetical protein
MNADKSVPHLDEKRYSNFLLVLKNVKLILHIYLSKVRAKKAKYVF